ncbi:UNVERIFIED_CONTAM: RNA cytidine acetyltransferase 2 [Sesamum latifolium]|uniref:RNA cytidine acetyltransferase 2 n=1 Tax=Sesamum latifolium TaxID=2727402 RepID=A0AAW2SGK2_9LAMI
MRKKVDERIRTLIENGVKARHRSMFVVIGDKSRDQIVNLHYMLSKSVVKSRPSVLWCYKDKLELSRWKLSDFNCLICEARSELDTLSLDFACVSVTEETELLTIDKLPTLELESKPYGLFTSFIVRMNISTTIG